MYTVRFTLCCKVLRVLTNSESHVSTTVPCMLVRPPLLVHNCLRVPRGLLFTLFQLDLWLGKHLGCEVFHLRQWFSMLAAQWNDLASFKNPDDWLGFIDPFCFNCLRYEPGHWDFEMLPRCSQSATKIRTTGLGFICVITGFSCLLITKQIVN